MRVALISLAFSLLISVPVLLFVYHQTDNLFELGIRTRMDDRERNLLYGYGTSGVAGVVAGADAGPAVAAGRSRNATSGRARTAAATRATPWGRARRSRAS